MVASSAGVERLGGSGPDRRQRLADRPATHRGGGGAHYFGWLALATRKRPRTFNHRLSGEDGGDGQALSERNASYTGEKWLQDVAAQASEQEHRAWRHSR
jgi:hypothetical protein